MGARIDYPGFLQAWSAESALFDERSAADDSEFSMDQVATAFLARILGREPDVAERTAFVDTYLSEWNAAVVYPRGIAGLVGANAIFVGDSFAADYAGPAAAGLTAFLVDPAGRHRVPADLRLRSLDDLPARLQIQHRISAADG
jgi:phosphoglycolate phosphatase-like HAD superfamily hydrolase